MKRRLAVVSILWIAGFCAWSQTALVKLRIQVALVDKDLNLKPVPRLALSLRAVSNTTPFAVTSVTTGFDGRAEVQVPPGRYVISNPQAVEFQGKRYQWEYEVAVYDGVQPLELSNDNAKVSEGTPQRLTDDLTVLFKRFQNSAVTVWSEIGHGTGFIVKPSGLVITNQHVIGTSERIAVQFDEGRKLPAALMAADAEKDVAVLWGEPLRHT